MRIDHLNSYRPKSTSESDLYRAMTEERVMQGVAIQHHGDFGSDEIVRDFKKNKTYLGFWPMFYAEVMMLHNPNDDLDNRVGEFAQGLVFGIANSKREHRHIVFQEAVLFWDYLRNSSQVSQTTTIDMIHAVTEEFSRRPQFQRTLSNLFCLNGDNRVEDHAKALPALNAYLLAHQDVAEAMFKPLKGEFLRAMNTYAPEVWKPHCKTSARIDMQMGRDLGL